MPAKNKSVRRRSKSGSRKMSMNNRPNNNNNQPKKSRRGKSGSKKGRKGRSRKKGERVGIITTYRPIVGKASQGKFTVEEERLINYALRQVIRDKINKEDLQKAHKSKIYKAFEDDDPNQISEKKIGSYLRTLVQECCNKLKKVGDISRYTNIENLDNIHDVKKKLNLNECAQPFKFLFKKDIQLVKNLKKELYNQIKTYDTLEIKIIGNGTQDEFEGLLNDVRINKQYIFYEYICQGDNFNSTPHSTNASSIASEASSPSSDVNCESLKSSITQSVDKLDCDSEKLTQIRGILDE